jgi:hypothetical protein
MNTPAVFIPANADRMRKVSSRDRRMMYEIEKWPANADDQWQRKMHEARSSAAQHGLDAELIRTAAIMGIARLVRTVDDFRTALFEQVKLFVTEHEFTISDMLDEMKYRIDVVRLAFDLNEEQVGYMVGAALARYVDDGGSPEVAILLADRMGVAEEKRSFLQLAVGI